MPDSRKHHITWAELAEKIAAMSDDHKRNAVMVQVGNPISTYDTVAYVSLEVASNSKFFYDGIPHLHTPIPWKS